MQSYVSIYSFTDFVFSKSWEILFYPKVTTTLFHIFFYNILDFVS